RSRRQNPRRNQKHSADRAENDRAPASPALREIANDGAAADCANGVDSRNHRLLTDSEAALSFQKCRIKILRAMRHVIERRHQQDDMNKERAVLPDESADVRRQVLFPLLVALPDW